MYRSTVGRSISSNLWAKVVGVIFVVLVVAGLRELIVNDPNFSRAFAAMMSVFPFADDIVGIICNMLDYHREFPVLTPSSFFIDLLKLVVMSCLRGPVVGWAATFFNPVRPNGTRSPVKQMLISLIVTPILAYVSSWLIDAAMMKLEQTFGSVLTTILCVVFIILAAFLSVYLFKALAKVSTGLAVAYRFLITFGVEMAANFLLSMICLALYVGIVVGNDSMVMSWGLGLLLYLAIMGVGLDLLRRSVVGTFR